MAKRRNKNTGKNGNNKPLIKSNAVQTTASNSMDGVKKDLEAGLNAVGNMVKNTSSDTVNGIGSLLIAATESSNAADEKSREKAAANLDENLQTLVGELKTLISKCQNESTDYQAKVNNLRQREDQAETDRGEANALKKQLTQDQQNIKSEQKAFFEKQSKLVDAERELEDQLLDAEAGFSIKNKEMLEKFRQDKAADVDYLEKKKTVLAIDIENLEEEKTNLKKSIESSSKDIKAEIENHKEELVARESSIEDEKLSLQRLQKKTDLREKALDLYRESDRDDIRNEFLAELNRAEDNAKELQNQLQIYRESEEEYRSKLANFSKWKEKIGDVNPEVLFKRIDALKTRNDELQGELDLKPSADIEEKNKQLRKENQDLAQDSDNKTAELNKVTTQLRQNRVAVIEREGLSKENLILNKQNDLLDGRIESLREEVDDLLSKQQSKTAFPALTAMDKSDKHNRTATTEKVGCLESFVLNMQQRIAWDPETKKELFFQEDDIRLFIAGLSMSRLHILQGISGTGKTSLALAFARAVGGESTTVPVQAGWRDKDDLIGHYNSFEKQFYERPCLQGIYEAQTPFYEDRPYIILLDEMNLSRPEQYFAEFLSALELDYKDQQLTLMTASHTGAPQRFTDGRLLQIPKNVWFIGTANHDETTFEFADKTYDRAHVMELPRSDHQFDIDKTVVETSYSYSSLTDAFDKAESRYESEVDEILEMLNISDAVTILADKLGVGWGNRLERQAKRFISTMMASGGTAEDALDHLLATKVLRHGKATGRYDTEREDIESLSNAITDLWSVLNFSKPPAASQKLLRDELKRKSSH